MVQLFKALSAERVIGGLVAAIIALLTFGFHAVYMWTQQNEKGLNDLGNRLIAVETSTCSADVCSGLSTAIAVGTQEAAYCRKEIDRIRDFRRFEYIESKIESVSMRLSIAEKELNVLSDRVRK